MIPGHPASNLRRDPSSPWRHLDWLLIGATLAVSLLGVLTVFSATRNDADVTGATSTTYLFRQLAFVIVGVSVAAVVAFFDYRRFQHLALVFYAGCVVLLVAVLTPVGVEVNGAQSWFAIGSFQVQPAEFAKLAVILVLALVCANAAVRGDGRALVTCLVIAGLPAGLILLQPDVGSVMVYVAVTAVVLVVAGVPLRHLVALSLVAIIGIIGAFELGMVDDHQRERLAVFVDGASEGAYNSDQAQTAIGAGGLTGAGLFEGTQTKLRYVPYRHSDFIFTVLGEELGFVGGMTLLSLYAVMAARIWRAASLARDLFGSLVCTGVLGLLLFQVFENMGMTMGIMPITGIPLPFMSYGGSSIITMFAAIGLVLNVHARRYS